MAKNYILEPVELEFEETIGVRAYAIPAVIDADALLEIPSDAKMQVGDNIFEYSHAQDDIWYFLESGNADNAIELSYGPDRDTSNLFKYIGGSAGTYTVSIYTETEDEDSEDDSDSKPYIDEKLSKNVTYTDHPHNNWEEVLSKKGDPKIGYNTIEKLASSTSEGGSDDGSFALAGINVLHAEFQDGSDLINISDVSFEDSPSGEDEAREFLNDLATKPSVVVWTYQSVTSFCWVVLVDPDQTMIQTICPDNNNTQVQLMPFALTAIDGTLSFAFIVS